MRNLRNRDGFTLIELMIVVVIIGILAAIAIPKFTSVSKSAKDSEADPILKQAYSLQESYKQKNDLYAPGSTELGQVGWEDQTGKYFVVSVKGADKAATFCIQAQPTQAGTDAGLVAKYITQARTVSTTACTK
ncbi:MAG TPA: prepilin-type N-terminal cleavage/methylation domain-containing protein [Longimicrobium sp.]|jgi:prepilin-type N-terminal cleavage/methylation domain-containing protein